MVVSGLRRLILRMVHAQCAAPRSGRSSRSTEVMTAWDSFIKAMDSATWVGSSISNGSGLPVCVLQNLQQRVQMSPPIMKVAVPLPQHSPILGQRPATANGMQAVRFNYTFGFGIPFIGSNTYFEPFGFAYSVFHDIDLLFTTDYTD